uniref:Uncharacterized protein n=1 Tax=Anopheles culicifacies TaxID=139723 RepID=A0A182MHR5_9DIPT
MDGCCLLAASVPMVTRSSSNNAATLHLTAAIAEAALRSLPLGYPSIISHEAKSKTLRHERSPERFRRKLGPVPHRKKTTTISCQEGPKISGIDTMRLCSYSDQSSRDVTCDRDREKFQLLNW